MAEKSIIGKWRIGEELGTGHFAKVKMGTHIETGKECAIKIVKKPQGARAAMPIESEGLGSDDARGG